jgi:hypothetical protein
MRIYYPGVVMIPLILLLIGLLSFTHGFGIVQVARAWTFWPVTLIATGLEEIYLWSISKEDR